MSGRIETATDPIPHLYRIGRGTDPLAWPPIERTGQNRFDGPTRQFRTLYAAEQRRACFVETLAPFRVSVEWLAAVAQIRAGKHGNDEPIGGVIPRDWLVRRRIGVFSLEPGQGWLDLRSLATRVALRSKFASLLSAHALADFDLGDALSRNRTLTRAIARWAYEHGYSGIVYKSRFDCAFDCWAIFDCSIISPIMVAPLAEDDADLMAVATLFDLVIR